MTKYGSKDLAKIAELTPTPETLVRRRIAALMQSITENSIRVDASVDQLNSYADQLDALNSCLSQHDNLDPGVLWKRIAEHQASKTDLFNATDFYFLLGQSNPVNLPMTLWRDADTIKGTIDSIGVAYEGPPDRVHGGVIAAIFDTLLARSLQLTAMRGVTAKLQIRYRHGTPLYSKLHLEANIVTEKDRRVVSKGVISANGKVCADAQGVFVKPRFI